MKDFYADLLVFLGIILVVLGLNLAWERHRHNQMERELEGWNNELREERMREAKEVLP
jgi:uncharacterized membrane protein